MEQAVSASSQLMTLPLEVIGEKEGEMEDNTELFVQVVPVIQVVQVVTKLSCCKETQSKYLDLLQKAVNQPREAVKEGENETRRVGESKTEGIMGEEKKVMELLEVVKDSTVLKGIMINKDMTPLR